MPVDFAKMHSTLFTAPNYILAQLWQLHHVRFICSCTQALYEFSLHVNTVKYYLGQCTFKTKFTRRHTLSAPFAVFSWLYELQVAMSATLFYSLSVLSQLHTHSVVFNFAFSIGLNVHVDSVCSIFIMCTVWCAPYDCEALNAATTPQSNFLCSLSVSLIWAARFNTFWPTMTHGWPFLRDWYWCI